MTSKYLTELFFFVIGVLSSGNAIIEVSLSYWERPSRRGAAPALWRTRCLAPAPP